MGGPTEDTSVDPNGATATLRPATQPDTPLPETDGATIIPRAAPRAATTGSAAKLVVDRDLQLEMVEHAAAVERMRRLMPTGLVLWLGFFGVDFVLATWVAPGDLRTYALLRIAGGVPLALTWARLRYGERPSPRALASYDLVMTSSCAATLSVMALLSGGLASPFLSYISLVLVGRAAVLPEHWKRGAITLGVPVLVSTAVLFGSTAWSPLIRAQLTEPRALGTYAFYLMHIFGAWLLLVLGGHFVWALRRQVFASRSIGRYRLRRRVGRGGMGEVWVAFDEQLRREVALKILRATDGTDPTIVQRFEREIIATAELSHPNTVRIFDHGVTEDGLWYYAMELLKGENLGELVEREGALDPARAASIVLQAARALAEAHNHGIVHRDIKPENVFIANLGGEDDVVKLLDFGIARIHDQADEKLTGTGWVAGTPMYLSPEGAAGREVGPAGDVYGLGGVLYWTLTGQTPFRADNSMQLMQLHMMAPPEPPSERLGRTIDAELEAVVMKCLAKDPAQRYADGRAVAQALASLRLDASPYS
jgi:serine/threonine-protein kinase